MAIFGKPKCDFYLCTPMFKKVYSGSPLIKVPTQAVKHISGYPGQILTTELNTIIIKGIIKLMNESNVPNLAEDYKSYLKYYTSTKTIQPHEFMEFLSSDMSLVLPRYDYKGKAFVEKTPGHAEACYKKVNAYFKSKPPHFTKIKAGLEFVAEDEDQILDMWEDDSIPSKPIIYLGMLTWFMPQGSRYLRYEALDLETVCDANKNFQTKVSGKPITTTNAEEDLLNAYFPIGSYVKFNYPPLVRLWTTANSQPVVRHAAFGNNELTGKVLAISQEPKIPGSYALTGEWKATVKVEGEAPKNFSSFELSKAEFPLSQKIKDKMIDIITKKISKTQHLGIFSSYDAFEIDGKKTWVWPPGSFAKRRISDLQIGLQEQIQEQFPKLWEFYESHPDYKGGDEYTCIVTDDPNWKPTKSHIKLIAAYKGNLSSATFYINDIPEASFEEKKVAMKWLDGYLNKLTKQGELIGFKINKDGATADLDVANKYYAYLIQNTEYLKQKIIALQSQLDDPLRIHEFTQLIVNQWFLDE